MIRRRRRATKKEAFDGINITPFTDILLVLLIIFMIAGSAMTPTGLGLAELGAVGEGEPPPEPAMTLLVEISSRGETRLVYEGKRLEWEQLGQLPATTPVTLRADEAATAQQLVSVVERLARWQLEKVQWAPPVSASELQQ